MCCGSWGLKESDTTERLNWTHLLEILTSDFFVYIFSLEFQSSLKVNSFPLRQLYYLLLHTYFLHLYVFLKRLLECGPLFTDSLYRRISYLTFETFTYFSLNHPTAVIPLSLLHFSWFYFFTIISSVQFSHSSMSDSATPWTAACQASLSITNSWSLPKPMSIESVMPSNHLILCCPLLLLPSIFPSIRVFSNTFK